MSTFWRRFLLLLGLIALGGGCNPLMLPFFMTANPIPKEKAEYLKLTSPDKKTEARVAIFTYMSLETRPEFLHADQDLARSLAIQLNNLAQQNEEKITIINPLKVEEYKRKHPDWDASHLDLVAVGKELQADYVIYLEIGGLSMYQPGTFGTFFRGQANITVNLVNVKKPDDFTLGAKEIQYSYPPESQGGNMPVDADTSPQLFKEKFLTALGRRLSWLFAERPTNDDYMSQ
jgi:hypothetical protein